MVFVLIKHGIKKTKKTGRRQGADIYIYTPGRRQGADIHIYTPGRGQGADIHTYTYKRLPYRYVQVPPRKGADNPRNSWPRRGR